MRRIVIIGAGQAGLVLALGLQKHGYDVTVVAEKTADEVRQGRLISNQCVFHPTLERERELGINFWDDEVQPVEEVAFNAAGTPDGTEPAIAWRQKFDHPAQSVDQRVKVSDWMTLFEAQGGEIRHHKVTPNDLDAYAAEFELVIVAAGRGPQFDALFPRNPEFSPYAEPQRAIGIAYIRTKHPMPPGLIFNLGPYGENFVLPVLSVQGKVHGIGFFGVPGGPMDVWHGVTDIDHHLEIATELLRTHFPWDKGILEEAEPAGPLELLHGGITPTVRNPVGRLPSGRLVLAMGDTAVTNDPVGGQGANMAARAARSYQEAILAQEDRYFDEKFMREAFGKYWEVAQHATAFNNALLAPPPEHVLATLDTAQRVPEVAHRFAHLFENPVGYTGWLTDPEVSMRYLQEATARV
ncbi:FAD-binding protein [Kibdelosporangium aridum]|uniref:FAD-binding protein n=1 Tax=Kibdelosporangium aridum TaxID=2030 RepID=A0A428ZEM0_KIBAR|nr:styrene monooxygenase/indole monooxygenase family protein [Kibdelosporangium aridum]RSM86553.1 FAD-binding protein [Kibdelosporangium aridum]